MTYSASPDRIAFVSSLPGTVGDIVRLIEQNATNEQGAELVQFVLSAVHPDMVCSLSVLHSLPASLKPAVSSFFLYALNEGISPELSAQLYDFLTPHLMRLLRPS